MANGKIRFGKQSGGELALVFPDGVNNTEVIVPESGILVTEESINPLIDGKVDKPELITITGSATFNGATQTIDLTNIGNITLAIGDVIQVTGTTSNNKLFTVESIPNANQIIVNYEHRGSSTPIPSKRLINETVNCTIKLYNRAKDAPLGQGQGWCRPASGRTYLTNYTNMSNRAIQISISQNTNATGPNQLLINGQKAGVAAHTNQHMNYSPVLENEDIYRLEQSSVITAWIELR